MKELFESVALRDYWFDLKNMKPLQDLQGRGIKNVLETTW